MPKADRERPPYIAQPALVQSVARQVEVYLKDQAAMEDYLIQQGIDGAMLKQGKRRRKSPGQDLARRRRSGAPRCAVFLEALPTPLSRHNSRTGRHPGALFPGAVDSRFARLAEKVAGAV